MLRRTHVEPYIAEQNGEIRVAFLADDGDGRVVALLDRLCRLARHLEGRSRATVIEALRRQESRVRDARRLDGIAKSLLDACTFRPPPGASDAPRIRAALFRARGELWPPLPGDERAPYDRAADQLGIAPSEIDRLLFADSAAAHALVRAPRLDGATLLDRYNLDLARGVLLGATRVTLTARGDWRGIFRAVKLARLMYRIDPAGPACYRVELTGPAAAFITRPQRYGARFARVIPALARAPGWSLDAEVLRDGKALRYRLDDYALPQRASQASPPFDSSWERDLAAEFADRLDADRAGWSLYREDTPVTVGGEVFLPDFTLRHRDGREALVEIVGFWTPEYLDAKLKKVAAAGLEHLVLVVYKGLAAGGRPHVDAGVARVEAAAAGPVLWFSDRPRVAPLLDAAERVARKPAGA